MNTTMTTEERLARIEAHLFGEPEQPQEQPKPKFESFYVDCTREEYPEVKRILEAQGYRLIGTEWINDEDCVSVLDNGQYFTYLSSHKGKDKPTLTLAQLREKYGVQPLPPLPDEPKKYEAGFWWNNAANLNLPDGSHIYLGIASGVWQKFGRNVNRSTKPHTLTPVKTHTVGKFYAIKGAEGEELNHYQNYALCVGEGKLFVKATDEHGVVEVVRLYFSDVSYLEVTPI